MFEHRISPEYILISLQNRTMSSKERNETTTPVVKTDESEAASNILEEDKIYDPQQNDVLLGRGSGGKKINN